MNTHSLDLNLDNTFAGNNSPVRRRASAFSRHTDHTGVVNVYMCDDRKDELQHYLSRIPYVENNEVSTIALATTALSRTIEPYDAEFFIRIRSGDPGLEVVKFHNLPFEDVNWSPVPGAPARSAKSTYLSELLLLAFGGYLGEPYGIKSEGSRLVNDLIPSIADLERHTGNGSRSTLGLHTENAALKYIEMGRDWSPKGLLLTGVSEQKVGGPSTPVALASQAVSKISKDDNILLRTPCMYIAVPERQRNTFAGKETVGPVPVISGKRGQEKIFAAFYADMMRPRCDASKAALERLGVALESVAIELHVCPGSLIYVANGQALHGRSQFEPEFDTLGRARRWIQRLVLTGRIDEFRDLDAVSERVFLMGA